MNINAQSFYNKHGYLYPYKGKYAKSWIFRNLIDDTFDFYFESLTRSPEAPFLNINNKYFMNGRGDIAHTSINYDDWSENYITRVHRSIMGDVKFKKADLIVMGLDRGYEGYTGEDAAIYRHIIMSNSMHNKKWVDFGYDDALLFKTIKQITFFPSNKKVPFNELNGNASGQDPIKVKGGNIIDFSYNNLYLLPRAINQLETHRVLFDVFIKNDNGKSHDFDYLLSAGKMTSNGTGSQKLDIAYEHEPNENIRYRGISKMGQIVIQNSTFYNYDKNKVEIGHGTNSAQGEIIPYNFSGSFQRELEMEINASLGKINMIWTKNLKHPALDPYEGIYQIEVKNTDSQLIESLRFIPEESMYILKDHDLSLVGLDRISIEK